MSSSCSLCSKKVGWYFKSVFPFSGPRVCDCCSAVCCRSCSRRSVSRPGGLLCLLCHRLQSASVCCDRLLLRQLPVRDLLHVARMLKRSTALCREKEDLIDLIVDGGARLHSSSAASSAYTTAVSSSSTTSSVYTSSATTSSTTPSSAGTSSTTPFLAATSSATTSSVHLPAANFSPSHSSPASVETTAVFPDDLRTTGDCYHEQTSGSSLYCLRSCCCCTPRSSRVAPELQQPVAGAGPATQDIDTASGAECGVLPCSDGVFPAYVTSDRHQLRQLPVRDLLHISRSLNRSTALCREKEDLIDLIIDGEAQLNSSSLPSSAQSSTNQHASTETAAFDMTSSTVPTAESDASDMTSSAVPTAETAASDMTSSAVPTAEAGIFDSAVRGVDPCDSAFSSDKGVRMVSGDDSSDLTTTAEVEVGAESSFVAADFKQNHRVSTNQRSGDEQEQLELTNQRTDGIQDQLESANQRTDGVREQLASTNQRTDSVQDQLASTNQRTDCVQEQVASANQRTDSSNEPGSDLDDTQVYLLCLEDLSLVTSERLISRLSVRQCRHLLALHRVSTHGLLERHELVERLVLLWRDIRRNRDVAERSECDDQLMCKVCWENVVDCVLLECGHMCACTACGKRMAECPICRRMVSRVVRVFRS